MKNIYMMWFLYDNKKANFNVSLVRGLKLIFLYMKWLFCPKTLILKPQLDLGVLGQNGLLHKLNIKSGLLPKLMFKITPINPHKHKTQFFILFLFTFPVSHPIFYSLWNFFLQNRSPTSGPLWGRHCWSYKASRLRLVSIFFLPCFM